jgi:O-acetyl-ADP-ribose deacetylase (regulator of RNase III)
VITYARGNILASRKETITCTVNCVGVMGKGLALEFKKTFPGMLGPYVEACATKKLAIGKPWIWKVNDVRQVLCFPTKDDWKRPSEYGFIESGLLAVAKMCREGEIHSLAVPPLGCGLGGLEWGKVKPMVEQALGGLDMDVEVFEP